ncbi:MAG: Na(+)-translocating NADH-quinone reductase subunit A [Oleiphilaceae bacterium]|uniref:Na(+)-translocating NADH-quinone reductase subunit A n=2 Tax=Oleiphilus sp. HI0125 TaxID=1822266 RepID=UPI0007C39103|nr:Na(+)-translocating NADH-quinone reductase subunit A [Oleiphilus sp. HI0125]KZZ56069.1 NADH:ubiquinone reductase (Na(+)-transporting) subunit A [Oleiphilus sp. HI0125]MCH2157725.1 Na(+)-translocating NADH-quinone reductase subunit A [Oleiphilaceae bacterium]
MVKIKKGLDLPITGAPEQKITDAKSVSRVALVGFDYVGMKPTMAVQVGDVVKKGQLLFEDKKTSGVRYTAPASGKVVEINRGERRVFQSIVIEVEGNDAESFDKYDTAAFESLTRDQVRDNLVASGMWTALRTRPFSKVPELGSVPNSIFVTAMDTNPLAADPSVVISEKAEAFSSGLTVLSKLTDGRVFVCCEAGKEPSVPSSSQIAVETFSGVHPAGNAGTHIHYLDPVSAEKTVWTISYQDVIAISELFATGELSVERVISLAGEGIAQPRLVRTQLGACVSDLVNGEGDNVTCRAISGSVFGGRTARDSVDFLGRYAQQISVIPEPQERELFGWLNPGMNKFSVMNIYLSKLMGSKLFSFSTTTNGSERAMVPVGAYERVMPLDVLPTQLLRALIVEDTEQAQQLGCLELDEEDLALCTFVCPGKYEYGPILRSNLTRIEKEG